MIMIRRSAKAWLGVSATHSATPRTGTMATNAPWAPDRRGVLAVTRELVPMRRHMHVPYRILVPRRGPRRLGGVAPARVPVLAGHCAGSIRVDTPSGVVDTAPGASERSAGNPGTRRDGRRQRFRGP